MLSLRSRIQRLSAVDRTPITTMATKKVQFVFFPMHNQSSIYDYYALQSRIQYPVVRTFGFQKGYNPMTSFYLNSIMKTFFFQVGGQVILAIETIEEHYSKAKELAHHQIIRTYEFQSISRTVVNTYVCDSLHTMPDVILAI